MSAIPLSGHDRLQIEMPGRGAASITVAHDRDFARLRDRIAVQVEYRKRKIRDAAEAGVNIHREIDPMALAREQGRMAWRLVNDIDFYWDGVWG